MGTPTTTSGATTTSVRMHFSLLMLGHLVTLADSRAVCSTESDTVANFAPS